MMNLNSPVSCFLGHVDVGKTTLLDYLRDSSVQKGEIGGITQQIGVTYFDKNKLNDLTHGLSKSLDIPGLLIIDTPGHDCFTEMRLIGMKVSHLPIVVIDIIKGVEKQTVQCIELLTKHNIKFIIVLNKMDKIYGFKTTHINGQFSSSIDNKNLKSVFARQPPQVMQRLKECATNIMVKLYDCNINTMLYYENTNSNDDVINMVPVSGKTGEGIPDLMMLISKITTLNLKKQINDQDSLYNNSFGYIIETGRSDGHGIINHCVLMSNDLSVGDRLLIESTDGSVIDATIKELLSPPNQKEMKNKVFLTINHKVNGTCCVAMKFTDNSLNDIIAPGGIFIKYETSSFAEISAKIKKEINKYNDKNTVDIMNENYYDTDNSIDTEIKFDSKGLIVNVPTKGMAHAIIKLIREENNDIYGDCGVKICGICIGRINKTTVIRAGTILSTLPTRDDDDYIYNKRYAVILHYDCVEMLKKIEYEHEIEQLLKKDDVKIIHGNTAYKLINTYKEYVESLNNKLRQRYPNVTNRNTKLQILSKYIFMKKSPFLFGIRIVNGAIEKNMILEAHKNNNKIILGKIVGLQKDSKNIDYGTKNDEICIRIESLNSTDYNEYGKDFDDTWELIPHLTLNDKIILNKYSDVFI